MPVIAAESVSKQFLIAHNASADLKVRFLGLLHRSQRQVVEEFWALRNVSLTIEYGEAIGLVGRNGSGKSTFLKIIAGIYRPTSGRVLIQRNAEISSMIELGVGFHGELTGRENVYLSASIRGLSRAEIDRIFAAVVDYSGLEHFIDVPIKNYSSGMHMRLGFSIAANINPDILLLDEIFAVGDADFQHKCTTTVKRFLDEGKTLLFVSHAAAAVRNLCKRVCVLDRGDLKFDGSVKEGLKYYDSLTLRQGDTISRRSASAARGTLSESDLNASMHRIASGGHWASTGAWIFDFLRRQQLSSSDVVLDVGCGSLNAALHLLPFLEPGHYWGFDLDSSVVEAGASIELPNAGVDSTAGQYIVNDRFRLDQVTADVDVAFASSLFPYLPFNGVALCIAAVVKHLAPAGRFYATWFENPDPSDFSPVVRPGGGLTYPDRQPFHYPLAWVEQVCDTVGARVERVEGEVSPRGESVLVIHKRPV